MISCIKMSFLYLVIYFNTPYHIIHVNISQYMDILLGVRCQPPPVKKILPTPANYKFADPLIYIAFQADKLISSYKIINKFLTSHCLIKNATQRNISALKI